MLPPLKFAPHSIYTKILNIGGPHFSKRSDSRQQIHLSNLLDPILATISSYPRRGIGSLLLTHGLEAIDNANSQSLLDTSPLERNIYLKYEWRAAVDGIGADVGKYGIDGGGEGLSLCLSLIRELKGP